MTRRRLGFGGLRSPDRMVLGVDARPAAVKTFLAAAKLAHLDSEA